MVILKEARNVKYADFVPPGKTLEIVVTMTKKDDRYAKFKFRGVADSLTSVSGRLTMERFNLAENDPALAIVDEQLIEHFRNARAKIMRQTDLIAAAS